MFRCCALGFGWLLVTAAALHAALTTGQLRCEFLTDPVALDTLTPRLGWVLSADGRGEKQTAYQILVASSAAKLAADQGDRWDSGKVASSEQNQIEYHGSPLGSDESAFWKVRAWDKNGQVGPWSSPACWTMGLLKPSDWKAQWIGHNVIHPWQNSQWIWSKAALPVTPQAPLTLRKTFDVPADFQVASARLFLSAFGPFGYTLNATEGDGTQAKPDANVPGREVAEYDVATALVPGANTLSVTATGTPGPIHGLKAWLGVTGTDGREIMVGTDASWTDGAALAVTEANPGGLVLGDLTPEVRHPTREYRREFTARAKPVRARLWISALGWEEPFLNGVRVGSDLLAPDETALSKHVEYLTYDVTGVVAPGANVLGVIAGYGRGDDSQAIFAQLRLDYSDGGSEWVVTDPAWKYTTEGAVRSSSMYDGERYDARREDGWMRAGYDDSTWAKASLVQGPAGAMSAKVNEPIRVVDTLKPVAITEPQPGYFIFDFGQNIAGWCRLHVSGEAGTTVTLHHGEALLPDGTLWTANLQGAPAWDSYTLGGHGAEVFEPRLTHHGFRYAEVTGFPGRPDLAALEACVVRDALPASGEFTCSNARLNRYWDMMQRTVADNYHGVPTDCPQRGERSGWLGDRTWEQQNEPWVFDGATLYAKWFRDIRDSQGTHGEIEGIAPHDPAKSFPDVTWASALVTIPERLVTHYGDLRLLAETYPAMKKWADGIATLEKNDTLPLDRYADWGCVFEDGPHKAQRAPTIPRPILGAATYVHDLRLLGRYARMLHLPEDAARFDAHADRLTAGFHRAFFSPVTNSYENGGETSFILPLAFGLVPEENRAAVTAAFLQRLKEDDDHSYCGVVGCGSLMHALLAIGRPDLPYAVAMQDSAPGWGMMVKHDATTFWEFWDDVINRSRAHVISYNHVMMIGDLGDWMVEHVAGLQTDPDAPGFRHFVVRPEPAGGVTSARMKYESLRGPVMTSWKLEGSVLTLDVTVPPNATATVSLPAGALEAVTENGAPAGTAAGVSAARFVDGRAEFEVGAGDYRFRAGE